MTVIYTTYTSHPHISPTYLTHIGTTCTCSIFARTAGRIQRYVGREDVGGAAQGCGWGNTHKGLCRGRGCGWGNTHKGLCSGSLHHCIAQTLVVVAKYSIMDCCVPNSSVFILFRCCVWLPCIGICVALEFMLCLGSSNVQAVC